MLTTHARPAASGKDHLITLWILSGLVGLGQWFRYFTGLLEVAAGIGLLTSRYAFYAAVLLAMVMAGAFIAHVTVLGSFPAAPIVLFVLTGIIAYLRKP